MATNFYGAVKQIVQEVNGENVFKMDEELDGWYQQGYHLFSTHVITSSPLGVTILYVLVRS